jgi:hypothetical protein
MTDQELIDNVGLILKVSSANIMAQVNFHKTQAIAKLYAKTKPFWIRVRKSLSLAIGDYLINMRDQFSDYWQLRHAKISGYEPMDIMSEGKFDSTYPDDSTVGHPTIVVPLDDFQVQFYPRASTAVDVTISYFYRPNMNSLSDIPEEWHFVIQDYVLAMIWPDTTQKMTMLKFFYDGLADIGANAKSFADDAIDLEPDPANAVIYGGMEDVR